MLYKIPKGNKVLWEKVNKVAADLIEADRKEMREVMELQEQLTEVKNEAFGGKNIPGTNISIKAKKLGATSSKPSIGGVFEGGIKLTDKGTSTSIFMKDGTEVTNDVATYLWMMAEVNGAKKEGGEITSTRLEKSGIKVDKLQDYMELPENKNLRDYADGLFKFYDDILERFEDTYKTATNRDIRVYDIDPGTGKKRRYAPVHAESLLKTLDDLLQGRDQQDPNSRKNLLSDRLKARTDNYKEAGVDDAGNTVYERNVQGRIKLTGATSVAVDYIKTMSHTKNFLPVNEEVNTLINPQTRGEIMERIGVKSTKELETTIDRMILGDNIYIDAVNTIVNSFNRFAISTTYRF